MGLFSKEVCCLCNINKGSKKMADGFVCDTCLEKGKGYIPFSNLKNLNKDDITSRISVKKIMDENLSKFNATKKFGNLFEIDECNKLWKAKGTYPNRVFSYKEIVSYELIQDDKVVSKGGLTGAIVGGTLFGGAGAVAGSIIGQKNVSMATKFYIKITTNNYVYPEVCIFFITTTKIKTDSALFKNYNDTAEKIINEISLMCNLQNEETKSETNSNSVADEIVKFKKLLDDGLITEEEFTAKKKQLLDL